MKEKSTLKELLKGVDQKSQSRFNELLDAIPENPNILWYPSSGNDFRDLLEFGPGGLNSPGLKELPHLFFHTDYLKEWLFLGQKETEFEEQGLKISVINKFELAFRFPFREYDVNRNYVHFADLASPRPEIYLLDLRIEADGVAPMEQTVFYFLFENFNFLVELLIKRGIKVSHLVKINEGCGFGGANKCIAAVYAFLSTLKTQYLVADFQQHVDFEMIQELKNKHKLQLYDYTTETVMNNLPWGYSRANIFQITYPPRKVLNKARLEVIIQEIADRNTP